MSFICVIEEEKERGIQKGRKRGEFEEGGREEREGEGEEEKREREGEGSGNHINW